MVGYIKLFNLYLHIFRLSLLSVVEFLVFKLEECSNVRANMRPLYPSDFQMLMLGCETMVLFGKL